MTVSYPRVMHESLRSIQKITWRAYNVNAPSTSPFTLQEQIISYAGQAWQADCTLPAMSRVKAETWIAFLVSLRGRLGSFILQDPSATHPRGDATSVTLTATAGNDFGTFTMAGQTLLAGDMFQIGSGSDATLHKMITDRSGTGAATFWPAVRKDRTSQPLTLVNPGGVFRLVSNVTEWDVDAVAGYGLTFSVQEVIS